MSFLESLFPENNPHERKAPWLKPASWQFSAWFLGGTIVSLGLVVGCYQALPDPDVLKDSLSYTAKPTPSPTPKPISTVTGSNGSLFPYVTPTPFFK